MEERIVVCLAVKGPHPVDYAQRVDSLVKRASAFGATLCACGWDGLAFAFHPDDAEESVEFCRAPDAEALTGPFCVGIAGGGWMPLMEPSTSIELGFGPALFRARAVAELARSGEVLIERSLQEGNRFPVTTAGPRSAQAPLPIEAFVLAAQREGAARTRVRVQLAPSTFSGRDAALDVISGEAGALATLRAAPGMGGSRVLLECALAAAPASTLMLRPSGAGVEPLGSLRRALAREIALFRSRPLSDKSAATLAAIVEGRGATVDDAAGLVEEWLAGPSPGLLLVDDANDVDASSLEVVASSLLSAAKPFRAVARLDAESPLPAVLALLAPGPEIVTGPLMLGDAESLAASWLGRSIDDDYVRKLVASCDGSPLAIHERLAEAVASGDLLRGDGSARARAGLTAAPPSASPRSCIVERLEHVSPGGKAVLLAVAMLGGDVSDELAAALVESAADVPVDFVDEVRALAEAAWLEEPEPGWLALPSRTHQRTILASLLQDRRGSWHRAASLTLETHGTGLSYAEAAWHAAMGGDDRRAARLANDAATIAQEAALEGAARVLAMIASSPVRWNPEADSSAGLGSSPSPMLTIPPSPEQALAARLAAHGRPAGAGDSYLPLDLPEQLSGAFPAPRPAAPPIPRPPRPANTSTMGARVDRPPAPPRPQSAAHTPRKLAPPEPPAPAAAPQPAAPVIAEARSQQTRESFASMPTTRIDEMAQTLPLVAREAIASGNEEALEQWFEDLAGAGKSPRLLERLRAIAALRSGDAGKAIATLRQACVQAESLGQVERSRSHLALAVGLTRLGRLTEALIEGLEALSRAREAADAHAELACLRFLQQLYGAAGHGDHAFVARRTCT